MKVIRFMILLLLLLCGLAIIYTVSYRIDLFPWGSSKTDGLFMIVIPVWILPFSYIVLMTKWFLERKNKTNIGYENYILLILFTLVGVLVMFDSQLMYSLCMVLSLSIIGLIIRSMTFNFPGK